MIKGIDYIGISAAAIIYRAGDGILFVHRTENCRDERHKRDFIGGGVDFGDTLLTTVKKEIKEEVDLTISNEQIHYLGLREQFREHEGKKTHRLGFYYLITLDTDQEPSIMEPHKFDDMRFFQLHALPPKEECHSMNYPTFQDFQAQIEQLTGKSLAI